MIRQLFTAFFVYAFLILFASSARAAGEPTPDLAFIDVNLVPMDAERVAPHQTVVVHGDTIVAVGPVGTTPVPPGARRIEGEGKAYLTPGLADMHTHVSDEDDLGLFIANGVTTVLHMGGTEQRLVGHIRGDIQRGEVVGPTMFFSLMVDGTDQFGVLQVGDPDLARSAVRLAKANGYDFIKAYNTLTPEEFDALVDEGRRLGLPLIGHGVRSVGLPAGLFRGQVMVAHAEEFLYTAFQHDREPRTMALVVDDVRRSGAWVTPTLSTFERIAEQWGAPARVSAYLASPEAQYASLSARLRWNRSFYMHRTGDLHAEMAFLRAFTPALSRAGVPLLAGTDSPEIPGMVPGFSLHDELKALVNCGLTPFQALSAATRSAGDFIQSTHPDRQGFGIIAVGRRADLMLADGDPLRAIDVLDHPRGVVAAGRWYDRTALDALLESRRARYAHLEVVS